MDDMFMMPGKPPAGVVEPGTWKTSPSKRKRKPPKPSPEATICSEPLKVSTAFTRLGPPAQLSST